MVEQVVPQLLLPFVAPNPTFRAFIHYLGSLVYYR